MSTLPSPLANVSGSSSTPFAKQRSSIMSPDDKVKVLKGIEFFQDVGDAHLATLATMCREVAFPAGANIFEAREPATDAYFILEGIVSLTSCNPTGRHQIALVGKGDLLGWSPLLGRSRYSDTASAETNVKMLAVAVKELRSLFQEELASGMAF
jgi:CRP-like cAMP-binding protein